MKNNQKDHYIPSLLSFYREKVFTDMLGEFKYSPMQVPFIKKIVISSGVGRATQNKKLLDSAFRDLSLIAAQKPVKTKAKKSIAGFKIRQGQEIGVMVTLRSKRMYDFLEKLIGVTLPRIRDFKGINSGAFDGKGNYSLSVKEHIVFPEIDYDKIDEIIGFNITVVTSANTDTEARALLKKMGFPFKGGN